jgi:hypothetical protein
VGGGSIRDAAHGAATIGGPDFGVHGEGYIRLSYANSRENIARAGAHQRVPADARRRRERYGLIL